MIERIFDLVTNNFIFVMIIIGVISSLFGKSEKKENYPNRPTHQGPQKTPTTKTFERKIEEMTKTAQTQAKKVSESVHPKKVEEVKPITQPQIEETHPNQYDHYAKQIAELERKADETMMAVTKIQKPTASPNQHRKKQLRMYSKNNLVNGLIMHEILSPPRAKKKFR